MENTVPTTGTDNRKPYRVGLVDETHYVVDVLAKHKDEAYTLGMNHDHAWVHLYDAGRLDVEEIQECRALLPPSQSRGDPGRSKPPSECPPAKNGVNS